MTELGYSQQGWIGGIGVGMTINQSNESAMHGTLTAPSGVVTCVMGRALRDICRLVLAHLLLAGFLFSQPVSGALVQGVQEIAVDNAVISSPQTTLASLVRLTDTFHELLKDNGITRENEGRLRNIHQQLKKLFDLREVPPKYRQHVVIETAVYLREALARHPLPSLEEVPDEDRMLEQTNEGRAALYRLPGTPVVIRKTDAGVYEGRYQFSSATLAEAKNWYEVSNAYPYLAGQEYIAGLYDDYFLTPGPLIPHELIRALPDWMQVQYLDQAVWQWLLLVVTVLVLAGLILLLHALVKRLAGGMNQVQQNLVFMLWPIGVIYLTLGARSFLDRQVILSGEVLQDVLFVAKLIMLAAAVYLVMRLGNILTETILAARHFDTRKIEQQLARLGIRMLTILVAVIMVIEGMQQIGFSLATLVAGAGVAGLAIALAAQDTLKNVFGGLLLAMDRPFEAGQRVRMKGYEGFIEEVGLRSTKIRTVQGHQIIIPNDEAARIEVENIGRRPNIRRDLNVTITYDTPPEKIARAVEILQEILAVPQTSPGEASDEGRTPHPNEAVNQQGFPPRVYFSDLNADSLNLLVVYWFHPPDHWLALEFAHRVNMQIMERFNAEGIDFAFPSQTLYLAGDSKRPLNLGQQPSSPQAGTAHVAADVLSSASSATRTVRPGAAKPGDATIEEELLHGEDAGDSGN
jgi:MscS family membrane protein